MSSPRAAQKTRARKAGPRPAAKPSGAGATASARALQLAAQMERGLADGRLDIVSPEARRHLLAAICKTYAREVQDGDAALPLQPRSGVSPTDVMITASALLRAVDLQVFELGMWQSWTGR